MTMSDRHYILDVSAIITMWLTPTGETNPLADFIGQAQDEGAQLWVAASELPTLEYLTERRLKQLGNETDSARSVTRKLLQQLLSHVSVLSNFGFEQKAIQEQATDLEHAQIAAAARSLPGRGATIITNDKTFDTLGELTTQMPKEAVGASPARDTSQPGPDNPIPFIDLAAQQARIRPEIEKRIETVLRHGK